MMNEAAVHEAVVKQIAIELGVDEGTVRSARSLRDGAGMDSVAAANILFALEEMYGVEVDLDGAISVDSVAEVVALLLSALRPH